VIDVREAIEEIQVRTGDQAYWHALEMVLGTLTARTLRSTLRLKIRGEDLSERERVAKGLAEIFSAQAATVENLARRESALRGPRPREAALQELEMHSHWVDFSDAANETRRAMGFVKRGIERGAKVVALLPSPNIEAYRREVAGSGCGEDLDSGRSKASSRSRGARDIRRSGWSERSRRRYSPRRPSTRPSHCESKRPWIP